MLAILAVLAAGCASRVAVELQPTPAVHLQADTVAVVAADRACRAYARALLLRLAEHGELRPDPRSDLRLTVLACGHDEEVRLVRDAAQDAEQQIAIDGRAFALVAVGDGDGLWAHLLGTSRAGEAAELRVGRRVQIGRSVHDKLVDAVASDLALQLSPSTYHVTRRVYPRAPDGSARQLHTEAVRAELAGDLHRAHDLALAAHRERPTHRAARYLASLERQLVDRLHVDPLPAEVP